MNTRFCRRSKKDKDDIFICHEVQSLLRHRPTQKAISSLQELGHCLKSLYSEAIASHDLIYPLWLTGKDEGYFYQIFKKD